MFFRRAVKFFIPLLALLVQACQGTDIEPEKKIIPVSDIKLSSESLELVEGDTLTLAATVLPENATDKTVSWSSSDDAVSTVNNNGRVTAVAEGSATITASCGKASKKCSVKVYKKVIPVESVTLDKDTVILNVGGVADLVATVLPEDATIKTVTWSTGDMSIATVDNGRITALKIGDTYIYAESGSKKDSCFLSVAPVPVESVTLDKDTVALKVGAEAVLRATVLPENATDKTVSWTVGDSSIASVEGGKVTALELGSTYVCAMSGDCVDSCLVSVIPTPVESVTLNRDTVALKVGAEAVLRATVLPEDATDKTVKWSVADPSIAKVDEGCVTALKLGSTYVCAMSGDCVDSCLVSVIPTPVESVTLNKSSLSLNVGSTSELVATVLPEDATSKTVVWSTDDETIAKVDGGEVTAVSPGQTKVYAECGKVWARCVVTVSAVPVESVTLNRTSVSLDIGGTVTLSAAVKPDNAGEKTVTWNTSDSKVATVNDDGLVKAVAPGSTTITAKAGGKSATCSVTVTRVGQSLSFASSSVAWEIGGGYDIGGEYDMPQSVSGARTSVSYSSGNTSVAEITPGQKIRIKGTGTSVITATASQTDYYASATASYSLVVYKDGEFSIENSSVSSYLADAANSYTDDNWSSVSVVKSYCSNSSSNRKDIPVPATVRWNGEPAATVTVYSNSGMSSEVASTTGSSNVAYIYNLFPGRTYYYKVMSGGETLKSGSIRTSGTRRMIKVSDSYSQSHANNCRDLGGLGTVDGRPLKYGLIYRGTNMDSTTDSEKELLTGYLGITTDVDLRGSKEVEEPLSSYGVTSVSAGFSNFDDLTDTDKIKTIFTGIIDCVQSGGVCYIHCMVGADRTGYICMLLEAALGVSAKDCSIDYELTSFSVVGTRSRNGTGDMYFSKGMNYINGYTGSTFKEKARNILLDAGITESQLSALDSAMLQ